MTHETQARLVVVGVGTGIAIHQTMRRVAAARLAEGRVPALMRRPPLQLIGDWKAGETPTAEDLVFSTRSGGPIAPNNVLRRAIFPACDRLKPGSGHAVSRR
ncbi:MAG TPA: hypothetical protein VIX35_05545 [Vicinamibacterales bacterium]